MANSLPIISTTVGSIPFYIKNEVEAILIPTQDSEALYNGIKRLIADSNLRQRIIHNAFELVQDFTVEKQVKKLLLNLSRITLTNRLPASNLTTTSRVYIIQWL